MATGACSRIQHALEEHLLWMACRRHVLELYLGTAWKKAFKAKSKQPADVLCERLWDHIQKNGLPKTLERDSCPFILKESAKLFKDQKERLVKLAAQMDKEPVGSAAKPRTDYEQLWELVKVSLFSFHTCFSQFLVSRKSQCFCHSHDF